MLYLFSGMSFVWILIFGYLIYIDQKQRKLEREIEMIKEFK